MTVAASASTIGNTEFNPEQLGKPVIVKACGLIFSGLVYLIAPFQAWDTNTLGNNNVIIIFIFIREA